MVFGIIFFHILRIFNSWINAGLEQGAKLEEMAGTIQNDILKEFMVRNTYIYPDVYKRQLIYFQRSSESFGCSSVTSHIPFNTA